MESLQIRTGQISLNVLDDQGESRGVFKFNPSDIESAKQVNLVQKEFEQREVEYQQRAEKCETVEDKVALLEEVVDYMEQSIDRVFGQGSSKILFGDAKTLSMFDDFFNGIAPYYNKAAEERMAKYNKKK